MSILREIQTAILSDNTDLSTALLKLRFLASRLGSEPLEEWVKYEAEGYPLDADVPPYRVISITYRGSWSGPFGSGIENAPIPTHLIEQYASKNWTRQKVRESIAGVEDLAQSDNLGIDASNLILVLQGKIYPDLACNSVVGAVSTAAIREIKHAVRSRILELTLELEKRVPSAIEITLNQPVQAAANNNATVTQIFNQTINGNVTHVATGAKSSVVLSIAAGDINSFVRELVKAGLTEVDAQEFSQIVASETPESQEKPLGNKALEWIGKNAPKAASGAWNIASSVLTSVLTEAAMKYYGLKP